MASIIKIGHRGAKGYQPENTLESIKQALAFKVDGIEIDVHLSADGELMVIHDDTIDRTTNGQGFVNQYTSAQLKKFTIDEIHKIPTLIEVLDTIKKKCFINIELKNSDTAKKTVELINTYITEKKWTYNHFLISSFEMKTLNEVRALDSNILIGILNANDIDQANAMAKYLDAYSIHPSFHLLTRENTLAMKKKKYKIIPWTVNNINDIEKMKAFGVDGIISDFPDLL